MAYYEREYRSGNVHGDGMYDFEYDEDYELGRRDRPETVRGHERGMRQYARRPIGRNRRPYYGGREESYRERPGYGTTRYIQGARRPRESAEYDYDFPGPERVPYGHTATDRWPDVGHDLDNPLPAERAMSDFDIREAVLENLFEDPWIDPERIHVSVQDGVVTLRGEVSDFMQARYAWDDAWETAGVRGVVNHLTVRSDVPSPEAAMPQTAGGRPAPRGWRRSGPQRPRSAYDEW